MKILDFAFTFLSGPCSLLGFWDLCWPQILIGNFVVESMIPIPDFGPDLCRWQNQRVPISAMTAWIPFFCWEVPQQALSRLSRNDREDWKRRNEQAESRKTSQRLFHWRFNTPHALRSASHFIKHLYERQEKGERERPRHRETEEKENRWDGRAPRGTWIFVITLLNDGWD